MKNPLRFLLICGLLLTQTAISQSYAQFTNSSHGILVSVDGKKVELAVAKNAAFRISMSYSGTPAPISSIMIDTIGQNLADFTVVSEAPIYGIKTAYGKIVINTTTKEWMLYDANDLALVHHGTFTSTSVTQSINDGAKSAGTFYGSGNFGTKNLIKTRSDAFSGNGIAGVPYFWNTTGYSAFGVSIDENDPAQWTKNNTAANWKFKGAAADLYIWPAKTQYDGLKVLSQLVGKSAMPPKWAFGFLQSQWGWKDRAYIEDVISKFRTKKLPVDAFIYDFEWYTVTPDYSLSKNGTATFSDFDFNPALFNEPAKQLADYKNQGIKSIGIRKPRMGNTANLDLARANGWLKFPDTDSRDMDFSNTSYQEWYKEHTKPLLNAGMDAWWNDEGESYYSLYYWWNKTQYDVLKAVKPDQRNFSINRAFSPGSQKFGFCTWTGDIPSDWVAMRKTPADLLNWSLAGMSYGSCDIGGFFGTPSDESMVRWYQVGSFLPIMRAHSTFDAKARFPWLYGTVSEAAIRKTLNLRYQLIPYYYSLGHEAYQTGAPVMRPLVMEFPNDSCVANLTDEWLMGSGLLVAPVMNEGGKRNVYLPNDIWYDFKKNTAIQGPATFNVSVALDETPVYVRAGTILPIGPVIQSTEKDTVTPLEIRVYPGRDGSFTMTEDDGKTNAYTLGNVRKTLYTWNDATKTLSWKVNGTYTDKKVFTTIKAVIGSEVQTATLGAEGQLVFTSFQLPQFSPAPGTYETSPQVSINNLSGGTIYYTIDGTTPTKASEVYTGPFNIPDKYIVVVKAFISKDGIDYPVTLAHYSIVNAQGEGAILMEKWSGLTSTSPAVTSIPVTTIPTSTSYLTDVLEIPGSNVPNFGVRVYGYLTAPESGKYTFYIAGDDNVQLRLGTTSERTSLTRIAYISGLGWTNSREWEKYPTQKSAPIELNGGQSYPIEALLKQVSGGSNMAVRWITPSGVDEVIPCRWLSTINLDACATNKSLQKMATASGQKMETESPIYAIDGDDNTKWCSTVPGDEWMVVDLGEETEICRWRVLHGGSEATAYISNDFKLQKKVGTSWVDVDKVTGNVENETNRSVTPFKAQFVRLYLSKPELNNANGLARIYDFSVYGSGQKPHLNLNLTETEIESIVNITPNPAQTTVQIEIADTKLKIDKMDIVSMNGVLIRSFAMKSSKKTLDISGLNAGVYFFRFHTNKETTLVKKFVKK